MKKFLSQWAWMLIAAVTLGGCVDNAKTLELVYHVALDDSCKFEVDSGSFRSRGHLDLNHDAFGGRPYYTIVAQVHNYMPNSLDVANAEPNAFDVHLTQATIKYEWLKGREQVLVVDPTLAAVLAIEDLEYVDYFNANVSAATNTGEAGQAVFWFYLLPDDIGQLMVQLGPRAYDVTLGVRVTLSGKTLGGLSVESGEFFYPIDLCWNCLSYVCCTDTADPMDDYYPSCKPGQDAYDLLGTDGCDCD